MKKILVLAAGALLMMSFTVFTGGVTDIISALKQNDAAQVSKYLDKVVDIKLPGKEEAKNISKTQATIILKDFYSKNDLKSFELTSKREMGSTGYLAGKLKSEGKDFNITLMLKTKDGTTSIATVRIN